MFPVCIKSQILEFLTCVREFYLQKNQTLTNQSVSEVKPIEMSYAVFSRIAPPLVVIHGLFGAKQNWTAKCKGFSINLDPPRKVIVVDCRNHGESPHTKDHTYQHIAADLKAFLDKYSYDKVALLGHSMGGRAAMLLALIHPERVEKLIVADISPVAGLHMKEFSKIFDTLLDVKLPSNVTLREAHNIIDKDLEPKITNGIFRAFILTNLKRNEDGSIVWRVNLQALKDNLNHIIDFPLEETMKYDGPTLFICGDKSDFVPKSDHPKIMNIFPNAKIQYIDGAGHWLHREKPQEFMDITTEFLNKH